MSQPPLFVASNALLRARVRLSGLESGADGEEIFEHAVVRARNRFLRRLGLARVQQVQGYPATTQPTTNEGVLRLAADVCEEQVVRLELLDYLGVRYLDGTAAAAQEWNDEGTLRAFLQEELERVRGRLEAEVEAALALLAGEQEIEQESAVNVSTLGPDEQPPLPFESVFGAGGCLLP